MAPRLRYTIDLTGRRPGAPQIDVRPLETTDVENLAPLMLAAYSGTIDDEGETLADAVREVDDWLADGGRLEFSFAATDGDSLQSVVLVSKDDRRTMIAYAMTAPAYTRRGSATAAVAATLDALAAEGTDVVELWITEGNTASERLFAKAGARAEP